MTCREYTLPRDEKSTDPKGWIRGNTKNGPVLEVTTSYLQGKYGVEIRIESVNKDHSHSWVRISHGLNKLVTDLIDKEYDDNEQETFETKTEIICVEDGSKMAGGGGNKKRFQYCTDSSGQEILCLRALQGHSGRNPILILHFRIMCLFRTISSSTFIILDVQSVYTPSQIQD